MFGLHSNPHDVVSHWLPGPGNGFGEAARPAEPIRTRKQEKSRKTESNRGVEAHKMCKVLPCPVDVALGRYEALVAKAQSGPGTQRNGNCWREEHPKTHMDAPGFSISVMGIELYFDVACLLVSSILVPPC